MSYRMLAGVAGIVAITCHAAASISTYSSDTTMIGGVTNAANFNGLVEDQSLSGYQEDGIRVHVNRDYFSWNAPGFDGSELFYASTGSLEQVEISLIDQSEFTDIDLQVSSGWSPFEIGTMYLWIQLYANGNLVGEFDLDATTGEFVGLTGGGFDMIKIGSYVTAEIRDEHDANARNAIAIDNISVGTLVPAPGTLALAVLPILCARRRR